MENNEKEIEFVSRHYKEGRLNTNNALKRFRKRAGIPSRTPHYKAIAASITLVIGISAALAYNWESLFPTTRDVTTTEKTQTVTTPIIEEKDSCVVLRYDNEPIGKILGELSAYYGRTITTNDSTRCVTGELEASSLDEIVDILQSALNINISVK